MATQPVGGAQPAQNPSESVNGRNNQTVPAIPAVNGGAGFNQDHSRKSSMTVTPSGANYNGGSAGGPQNKPGIQFGALNPAGNSPAMGNASLPPHNNSNLGVNQLGQNPRAPSPHAPSPIPQPSEPSGGRPPSNFGQNGVVFGQQGENDQSGQPRSVSNVQFGNHDRRGSSHSMQSDFGGNQNLPSGPNPRNFQSPAGRGRGGSYNGGYNAPMPYHNSPSNSFRGQPNGRGMPYSGGRHQQVPGFQGSPSMRPSNPAMNNHPGTPQQMHIQMQQQNGMAGQPYYYGAPPQGGPPMQVDPSIQMNYQYNMMQGQYPQYPNQPSPRAFQPGYGVSMQPTYSNQGQAPSMSRASSQMSNAPERPGSSVGHQPHTPSMPSSSMPMQSTSRAPSMSQPKPSSNFSIPEKKKAAIVIKNPNTGEALNFKDKAPTSPAPTSATAPVVTPSIPTPPSRTPSAVDQGHTRTESVSTKTDEERKRAMREAVERRIAEQKEQDKKDDPLEEKAEIHQEQSDAAKVEAEEAKAAADKLEKEAAAAEQVKAADVPPTTEPVKEEETPAEPAVSKPADDDEPDYDAIEAEYAAMEAEEARQEAEYQKKKAEKKAAEAEREKKEAEELESKMKEREREAEERELQREKEREAGGTSDDESKRMFAELKAGVKTPASTDTPAEATPSGPSGAATPVSDVSMPPPARSLAPKRGKAAELTLDTKKPIEPPEPSATLKALQSAKKLKDLSKVSYPSEIASPNPALNENAPANRGFKYDKTFLLQFQSIFKEKPSIDWDAKLKDVMGDGDQSARTAKTPSSGMGGRQFSQRGLAQNNFPGPMGAFNRAPLPPGTTSEQRFAMSNAGMGRGGMPMQNPFGPMGRGGMAMGRQPSNTMPGSPRVGGQSRGGSRAESKRTKQSAKQIAEENKSMPLTAGMNVGTLEVSSTGWKARSLGQPSLGPTPGGDVLMDPETVQRKVKAALNKMTPEKFEKIADSILAIAAQSKEESDGRTLRQVIQLTFEKATDEAHWASMYAKFCLKTLQSMSPDIKDENVKDKNGNIVTGGNLFRKYLLNRCQEEFERGWKVNIPQPKEGQDAEAAILSDEYYVAMAAKRRGLGLVKFIGELFKLGMLTERIMHECVKKLVDYEGTPDEAEIESLTSLLRTIGRQLDDPSSKGQGRMDVYFERIRSIMDLPDLNSRLKFMLLDVIDLRKNHWISKDDEKGPKTITQIREDAERQQQADEAARLAQQANRGRGGPMPMGRGDARSFSYGQVPPPDNSNRVATDDLRRLGASRSNRNASNTGGMGPALLGPRTNSGRRGLGPGSAFNRGDDSNASSRTGTPPATKKEEKKDESSTNAFSALAALESDPPNSPPSNPGSPPSQQAQPSIDRSRSPDAKAD